MTSLWKVGTNQTGTAEIVSEDGVASLEVDGQKIPTDSVSGATVGEINGPAGPLDAQKKIPIAQMPIDGLTYRGVWDASTNTPTLTDGTGAAGDFYRVSVAGTQDLGSGSQEFSIADHVLYEGAVWERHGGGGVQTINGKIGPDVTLAAADVGAVAEDTALLVGGNASTAALEFGTTSDQEVKILHNGSPYITIKQLGVGIAVDNPTAPLHVGGGMFLEAGSITYEVNLSTGTKTSIGNLTNHPLEILANGAVHLTLDGTKVTAAVDLHMSQKKIIDMGNPDNPRDGVNLQTLDGRLTTVQRTAIDALAAIATADAVDPATTMALVNECKAKINGVINALQAT